MKTKNLIIFFAAIFLQLQRNVYGFNQDRILNGSDTPAGEFEFLPEIISVTPQNPKSDISGCSSTIISKRHILTAAHCVYSESQHKLPHNIVFKLHRTETFFVDYRPKNKMVTGNKQIHVSLKDYSIQPKIYFHPSFYTVQLLVNDIAIIEFPVGTNLNITPIPLVSNFVEKDNDTAIAAGYGLMKYDVNQNNDLINVKFPDILQNVTVDLHTPLNCKDLQGEMFEGAICTGTRDYRGAQGDSGGPLLVKRNGKMYQVGVLSAGLLHNALYTKLSLTCAWITKVTNGEVECGLLPDETNSEPLQPDDSSNQQPPLEPDQSPTSIPSNEIKATSASQLPDPAPLKSNTSFTTFNILFLFFAIFLFV
uniref:Peptidase S1 domain-containing protein n=1 Tax=Panagrolaimus sp. ES5 TaxID=591445 RepID=A0AC34FIL3_9BILA